MATACAPWMDRTAVLPNKLHDRWPNKQESHRTKEFEPMNEAQNTREDHAEPATGQAAGAAAAESSTDIMAASDTAPAPGAAVPSSSAECDYTPAAERIRQFSKAKLESVGISATDADVIMNGLEQLTAADATRFNRETVQTQMLAIADIVTDAGTLVRANANPHVVREYAVAMEGGATFPPISVFYDGTNLYLADGLHRLTASIQTGRVEIPAEMHSGTAKDALWFGLGANRNHGLRLSAGDKKRAIVKAVQEFPEKSQTLIAEHVGCAQSYVNRIRKCVSIDSRANEAGQDITSDSLDTTTRVRGKDGKSYPSSRRRKAEAPATREAAEAPSGTPGTDSSNAAAEATPPPSGTPTAPSMSADAGPAAEAILPKQGAPDPTPAGTEVEPTSEQVLRVVLSTIESAAPSTSIAGSRGLILAALTAHFPAFTARVRQSLGEAATATPRPKLII